MFWWLIFFTLLFFVPFVRYALLFFIIFIVISILLTVMEVFGGIVRSGKRNARVFRPQQKSKPPPWPAPKDDIEDAEFREEKK